MLPDSYLNKMKTLLKDEYDDYLAYFNHKPYKGLRVNTNKININDFLNIFPFELKPIPWTNDGFYYEDDEVSKHSLFYAGAYYIQEPSAMLPGELLPVEENDLVLDACAAPGGKSLKILNKLNNTGILLSNDISASRANALLRNIERQGYSNYFVSVSDLKDLEKKYPKTFDKILLDAPCSGEGMFRKEPSLIKSWQEKGNDYYSDIQKELIVSALNMLKDGGCLLYSTCTFDEKEDEDIIEYALDRFNDLKILPIKLYEGFRQGKNNLGVKLFPHLIEGEGHYACLIQKGETNKKEYHKELIDKPDLDFLKLINKDFYNGDFKIINDNLYFVPSFDTKGIRILRSGLLLGEIKKNSFKPAQSLAMSLNKDEFRNIINLNYNDAIRYLKGETLYTNIENNDYYLICYNNLPLGFSKTNNKQIKNLIDKGWIKR